MCKICDNLLQSYGHVKNGDFTCDTLLLLLLSMHRALFIVLIIREAPALAVS